MLQLFMVFSQIVLKFTESFCQFASTSTSFLTNILKVMKQQIFILEVCHSMDFGNDKMANFTFQFYLQVLSKRHYSACVSGPVWCPQSSLEMRAILMYLRRFGDDRGSRRRFYVLLATVGVAESASTFS